MNFISAIVVLRPAFLGVSVDVCQVAFGATKGNDVLVGAILAVDAEIKASLIGEDLASGAIAAWGAFAIGCKGSIEQDAGIRCHGFPGMGLVS